jgi:hypothetical protein
MKLDDLLVKRIPLIIDGETVEDIFIQELPVSELASLTEVGKEKDLKIQLELATDLVNKSLVLKDGESAITDKPLSSNFIMKVMNIISEINIPEGK